MKPINTWVHQIVAYFIPNHLPSFIRRPGTLVRSVMVRWASEGALEKIELVRGSPDA